MSIEKQDNILIISNAEDCGIGFILGLNNIDPISFD